MSIRDRYIGTQRVCVRARVREIQKSTER